LIDLPGQYFQPLERRLGGETRNFDRETGDRAALYKLSKQATFQSATLEIRIHPGQTGCLRAPSRIASQTGSICKDRSGIMKRVRSTHSKDVGQDRTIDPGLLLTNVETLSYAGVHMCI
jgi:hypothetical protein